MLDLLLANKLVKAIPQGAHLLLVGDVDQLPSVGAGEVLRDLLAEGGPLPSVRLTRIFRQAARSGVVTNAHRINAGDYPQLRGLEDFFLFPADDADTAAALTVDVVTRRIPARFGFDPRRDIQVLTPMHRGPAGAAALNTALQDAMTPGRADLPERRYGGRVFRVGDKVSQIRNNYDKGANGVFNGTQGVVIAVDLNESALTVRTEDDEDVDYEFSELDELMHRRLFEFAGRGHVWEMLEPIKRQFDRVRWLLLGHVAGHAERALGEHEQMLAQMASRDVAGLGASVLSHINHITGHLSALREQAPESYFSD